MHACTRRSFMKEGALALVGDGRGARLRGPQRAGAVARGAVEGAGRDLPARRGGRPEHARAARRPRLLRRARQHRDRAARRRRRARVDLDGFFGLHPSLSALKPLWDERRLAAVHACGSPDTTRSHFDAQDYMESGTPGVKSTEDGWLARGLAAMPAAAASPFRAVALGPALPRVLRGDAGAVAMTQPRRVRHPRGGAHARAVGSTRDAGFESLYEQGVRDLLYGTGRETFDAVKMLKAAAPQRLQPANGAVYPRGRFGESLRQIAQLIRADVGPRGRVRRRRRLGHARRAGQRARTAGAAAQGVRRRPRRVRSRPRRAHARRGGADDVGVRPDGARERQPRHRPRPRAPRCSCWAARAKGGTVHGRWPGLSREQLHEGRDLAVTTDFRSLFAEVAVRHLGVPGDPLFPGFKNSAYPGRDGVETDVGQRSARPATAANAGGHREAEAPHAACDVEPVRPGGV